MDLAASDTRVVAPVSGVVSFAGVVVDRGVMTITTDKGHKVSLEPVTSVVSPGTRINAGDYIADLNEGHCQIVCLHLGLRVPDDYRSPRLELGVLQRAVLLPW